MAGKVYTIPLRREFQKVSYKRKTNKAVRAVKEYVTKHTKQENVVIGEELNEKLWSNGITNPPPRVKVEITLDKDGAFVNLVGFERKKVEASQKKVIGKSSMKEKLAGKVEDLKAKANPKEEVAEPAEEKAETPKIEKKEETPTESKEEAPKVEKEEKPAEPKEEAKPEPKKAE